jgi:hypothetical protein
VERVFDPAALRAFTGQLSPTLTARGALHDPEWFCALRCREPHELLVLADREDHRVVGLLMANIAPATLDYGLGGLTFFRLPVTQCTMHPGPISARQGSEGDLISGCLTTLADALPRGAVVYANAVPVESALHHLLQSLGIARSHFHVLAWGGESAHCSAVWTGSVETYLKSIGKDSRKDLKKCAKKLLEDPTVQCRLKAFKTIDDIDEFMSECVRVSDKTYQKKELGLGVSRGGWEEAKIRFAAERGGFLGYILYIDNEPCAFQYCFVKDGICALVQTGYDPAHAARQVGSVLFYLMLCELERAKEPVEELDFGPHSSAFKARTANRKRRVRNYYLFRRTWIGALQFVSLFLVNRLSIVGGDILARTGLRKRRAN